MYPRHHEMVEAMHTLIERYENELVYMIDDEHFVRECSFSLCPLCLASGYPGPTYDGDSPICLDCAWYQMTGKFCNQLVTGEDGVKSYGYDIPADIRIKQLNNWLDQYTAEEQK